MNRFKTSTGGFVTAESLEAASTIAAEYGMGEIVCAVTAPEKVKTEIRDGRFAVVNFGIEVHIGSFASCAEYQYNHGGSIMYVKNDGSRDKLNEAERRQLRAWLRDAE